MRPRFLVNFWFWWEEKRSLRLEHFALNLWFPGCTWGPFEMARGTGSLGGGGIPRIRGLFRDHMFCPSQGPANHLSVKLEGSVTGSSGGDRRSPGAPGGVFGSGSKGRTFLGPLVLLTRR